MASHKKPGGVKNGARKEESLFRCSNLSKSISTLHPLNKKSVYTKNSIFLRISTMINRV
jgi:hypothetical protein